MCFLFVHFVFYFATKRVLDSVNHQTTLLSYVLGGRGGGGGGGGGGVTYQAIFGRLFLP